MLELAYVLVVGIVGVGFIGYVTPKIVIWGSLGTAMMWAMAHLIRLSRRTRYSRRLVRRGLVVAGREDNLPAGVFRLAQPVGLPRFGERQHRVERHRDGAVCE